MENSEFSPTVFVNDLVGTQEVSGHQERPRDMNKLFKPFQPLKSFIDDLIWSQNIDKSFESYAEEQFPPELANFTDRFISENVPQDLPRLSEELRVQVRRAAELGYHLAKTSYSRNTDSLVPVPSAELCDWYATAFNETTEDGRKAGSIHMSIDSIIDPIEVKPQKEETYRKLIERFESLNPEFARYVNDVCAKGYSSGSDAATWCELVSFHMLGLSALSVDNITHYSSLPTPAELLEESYSGPTGEETKHMFDTFNISKDIVDQRIEKGPPSDHDLSESQEFFTKATQQDLEAYIDAFVAELPEEDRAGYKYGGIATYFLIRKWITTHVRRAGIFPGVSKDVIDTYNAAVGSKIEKEGGISRERFVQKHIEYAPEFGRYISTMSTNLLPDSTPEQKTKFQDLGCRVFDIMMCTWQDKIQQRVA